MNYYLLIIILLFTILPYSCYYDNEEELYPEISTDCDTLNITYSEEITAIFQDNCWSCHSNNNAAAFGANITLEDYSDVVSNDIAVLGSIKHNPGYSPMPKNGGKLDDCSISQFEAWINQGSPQN